MLAFREMNGAGSVSLVVGLIAVLGAVFLAAPARAQEPGGEEGSAPASEGVIEWNFRPLESATELSRSDLEARWAAPFAVESRGRPAPRERREVVVIRGRPLEVAADSGETAAVVEVEEGEGLPEDVFELAQLTEEVRAETAEEPGATETEAEDEADSEAAGEDEGEESEEPAEAPAEEAQEVEDQRDGETPAAESAASSSPRTHTVTRGDTLFGIARRYGVAADAIREANDMEDDIVRLGETLVIPDEEEGS